ncbi:MAG: DUF3298 and DUF4163 domain-containing protein [Alistipes sp.]|jgi:hypothetical protein|nr:DUF3298 and DUF4163 domain-containing protein [Alistipes sp.]
MKRTFNILSVAAIAGLTAVTSCAPDAVPEMAVVEKTESIASGENSFDMDYRFEYLAAYGDNDEVARKIRQGQIVDFFGSVMVEALGTDEFMNDPVEAAAAFDEFNRMGYVAAAAEFPFDGFMSARSWTEIVNERILAYTVEEASYTGGAHGMEFTKYSNYDLQTGHRLALADLFSPEGLAALPGVIAGRILEDNGETDWQALAAKTCYCDQGDVYASENFLLASDRITFFYNPYDISCYAQGPTKVEVELEGLEGFRDEMVEK